MTTDTLLPSAFQADSASSTGGMPASRHRLDQAPRGTRFTVRQVQPDPQAPERARQLEEIGFVPGEQGVVMTRGFPGGEPLVVRIGQSTFALRGAEAACVQIEGAGGVHAA